MSRVIQDSDDELDDDVDADVQRPGQDTSPKLSISNASSTEALRQQIEVAHRAHLQSQFPVQNDQARAMFETNSRKRKFTADIELNVNAIETSRRPSVANGKTSLASMSSSSVSQRQDQVHLGQLTYSAETDGADCVLEGKAYSQHDANAMVPDPSSTIPNATQTQQRMMEKVLAPAFLGSDNDGSRVPFEPNASIPWSEYLNSPPDIIEHPKSSAQNISAAPRGASPHELSPIKSQRQRQESLTLVDCSSTQDMPLNHIDTHEITVFPKNEDRPETTQSRSRTSPCLIVEHPSKGNSTSSVQQLQEVRRSSGPGAGSNDDLVNLEFPREQYQPRPSRSTSSKIGTQEIVDYSVKSEKAAKVSRRKKSNPAAASQADSLSTPKKVRPVREVSSTSCTNERNPQKKNNDVTRITDREIRDGLNLKVSQMPQVNHCLMSEGVGSPKHGGDFHTDKFNINHMAAAGVGTVSDTINEDTTSAAGDTVASVADLRSPSKVQVVIPAKSPTLNARPPQKEINGRKLGSAQPELTAPVETAKGATIEKKRGRGRPRMAAKASISEDTSPAQEEEHKALNNRPASSQRVEGAQPTLAQDHKDGDMTDRHTLKSGQGTKSIKPDDDMAAEVTARSTPELILPARPEVEPITPERVKKPASREQPLNRAKVVYRVGLSKRAKIAPLLRTMKK
ncbi:hypothetical protein OPT61_g2752 [Boeremia exigua]|uniref:Uncharacterized protein n=1 Tax=Boeremia exigua TaxID=749465 RepID=A0ACC2IKJ8_9PLEO|nr:hypothetical protein OPT61_g2752 [Boeremia exigua]